MGLRKRECKILLRALYAGRWIPLRSLRRRLLAGNIARLEPIPVALETEPNLGLQAKRLLQSVGEVGGDWGSAGDDGAEPLAGQPQARYRR